MRSLCSDRGVIFPMNCSTFYFISLVCQLSVCCMSCYCTNGFEAISITSNFAINSSHSHLSYPVLHISLISPSPGLAHPSTQLLCIYLDFSAHLLTYTGISHQPLQIPVNFLCSIIKSSCVHNVLFSSSFLFFR